MSSALKRQLATIGGFGFFGLVMLFQSRGWDMRYVFFLAALAGTLFLLSHVFSNLKRARLIEDTPTSKIRSAAQGYVEISGMAKLPPEQPLLYAPLTLMPCLWFRFIIEEYRQSGKNSSWQIIESAQSDAFFLLDDHSGQCLIDPREAETTSLHRQRWRGNSRRPAHGADETSSGLFGFGKQYRYTEWRIHTDDLVYALGHLQTARSASIDEQIQQQQGAILNEWKLDQGALLKRFDSNHDGEINQAEWERARRHAQFHAEKTVHSTATATSISVLGYSGQHHNQPFILSAIDPELLARRYRWRAFASAAGFVGACLLMFGFARQWFGLI